MGIFHKCKNFLIPYVLLAFFFVSILESKATNLYTKSIQNSTFDTTVCGATRVPIRGSKPLIEETGIWKLIKGKGNIIDSTAYNTLVQNLSGGETNIFVWTVISNSIIVSRDTVSIYNGIQPSQANITSPVTKPLRICGDSATMVALLPSSGKGMWISKGGFIEDPFDNVLKIKNLPFGSTNITWRVRSKGCNDNNFSTDIYNDAPSLAFAGKDTAICKNELQLNADTLIKGSGFWTTNEGLINIIEPSKPKTIVKNLKEGINKLIWTTSNASCKSNDTLTIINESPTKSSVNNRSPYSCGDTIVTASPIIQGRGTWYVKKGSVVNVNQIDPLTAEIKNLAEFENLIYWKVENSTCPIYYDSLVIFNKKPSNAQIITPDTLVCANSLIIKGKFPTQGRIEWTWLINKKEVLVGSTNTIKIDTLRQDTNTFKYAIYNGGCFPSTKTLKIINQVPKPLFAGRDTNICSNTITLNATPPKNGYTATWLLINNQSSVVFNTLSKPNASVTNLEKGDNFFIWKVSKTGSNCPGNVSSAYDTVKIRNNIPYPIFAGKDQDFCDSTVKVEPEQYFDSEKRNDFIDQKVVWKYMKGPVKAIPMFDSLKAIQTISGLKYAGIYTFILNVKKGTCAVSDTIQFFRNQFNKITATGPENTCSPQDSLKGYDPKIDFPATGKSLWRIISDPQKNVTTLSQPNNHNTLVEKMNFVDTSYFFQYLMWNKQCDTLRENVTIKRNKYYKGKVMSPLIEECKDTITLEAYPPEKGNGNWVALSGKSTLKVDPVNKNKAYAYGLQFYEKDNTGSEAVFSWNVLNGQCISAGAEVVVKKFLQPKPFKLENPMVFICESELLSIVGKEPDKLEGTGQWFLNNQFLSDSSKVDLSGIKNFTSGRHIFKWIISNGIKCIPVSDSIIVERFSQLPKPILTTDNDTTCKAVVVLKVKSNSSLTGNLTPLYLKRALINKLENGSDTYIVSNLSVGETFLKYEVSNGPCKNSDTIRLTYGIMPTLAKIFPNADTTVCENDLKTDFYVRAKAPENGNRGFWETGVNTKLLTKADSSAATLSLSAGINQVIWTTVGASSFCFSKDTLKINVRLKPERRDAGDDRIVHDADGTMNALPPEIGLGTWKILSGYAKILNIHDPKASYTDLAMGKNFFVWIVGNEACDPIADTLSIERVKFDVPKAFSPNKDQINDKFVIRGVSEYYPRELTVYNRWGMEVYKNIAYNNDWEGQDLNGTDLVEDTYYYMLKLQNKNIHTGFIILKR